MRVYRYEGHTLRLTEKQTEALAQRFEKAAEAEAEPSINFPGHVLLVTDYCPLCESFHKGECLNCPAADRAWSCWEWLRTAAKMPTYLRFDHDIFECRSRYLPAARRWLRRTAKRLRELPKETRKTKEVPDEKT